MTQFGSSIETSRPSLSFEADYLENRCTRPSNYVLGLVLPSPSIEPITFPCRADSLHVMAWTRVINYKLKMTEIWRGDSEDNKISNSHC